MTRTLLILAVAAAFSLSLALPWVSLPSDVAQAFLVELRLPRAMLALTYGMALGGCGAAIQTIFANPLASPDLTGTTSGAALGAVIAAYLFDFASPFAMSFGSVAGALAALGLLLLLAGPRAETSTLLLAGLALSALAGALTTLALALAPSPFAFYDAYEWLMGSLVDRSLSQALFALVPTVACLVLLTSQVRALDSLALGEQSAQAIGHDLRKLRLIVIAATAVAVGSCVAVCGAIGFIGLVAPIFARRLSGGRPGSAILPAALIGALLLLTADLVVRLAPLGRTLPIGVATAVLGAPFFLWLVTHMRWRLGR